MDTTLVNMAFLELVKDRHWRNGYLVILANYIAKTGHIPRDLIDLRGKDYDKFYAKYGSVIKDVDVRAW